MTDTADEITTSIETVRSAVADAAGQARGACECAGELGEQAAAHGWHGVAAGMQAASDSLEEVIASLGTAEQGVETAVTAVGAITHQMSSQEVAEHLTSAGQGLDEAGTAIDAAVDSVDDALRAGQQAGEPDTLMGMIRDVVDGLDDARRDVEDARGKVDTERQQAVAWGN